MTTSPRQFDIFTALLILNGPTQLAKSRRAGPRGYETPLATELLPRDRAIPLVRRMLDYSDDSNRIDAVAAYAALDPDGMPPLLGKLRNGSDP